VDRRAVDSGSGWPAESYRLDAPAYAAGRTRRSRRRMPSGNVGPGAARISPSSSGEPAWRRASSRARLRAPFRMTQKWFDRNSGLPYRENARINHQSARTRHSYTASTPLACSLRVQVPWPTRSPAQSTEKRLDPAAFGPSRGPPPGHLRNTGPDSGRARPPPSASPTSSGPAPSPSPPSRRSRDRLATREASRATSLTNPAVALASADSRPAGAPEAAGGQQGPGLQLRSTSIGM
jgi:hypothetical protein